MANHKYLFDAVLLQEQIRKLHMERKAGKVPSKRVADFHADHVVSHIRGGIHRVDNYLPACFICNNYRWHYLAEELQLILKIGVWAKTEIEKKSALGNEMALKFVAKENKRINTSPGKKGVQQPASGLAENHD